MSTPVPATMTATGVTIPGARLGETVRALTASLVHPPDLAWRTQFNDLLEPLRAAFREHRVVTEGDDGLYAGVVGDAPRLARAVDDLVAEHGHLHRTIESLAAAAERTDADAEAVRAIAVQMLGELARHRQNDADLVHEAYTIDIGGE